MRNIDATRNSTNQINWETPHLDALFNGVEESKVVKMQQKVYDSTFFEYTSQHSAKSAKLLIPVIKDLLPDIKSVVDFGCAQGVWLKTWNENGANEILGIDGDYVDRSDIVIPLDRFIAKDLNEPIPWAKNSIWHTA